MRGAAKRRSAAPSSNPRSRKERRGGPPSRSVVSPPPRPPPDVGVANERPRSRSGKKYDKSGSAWSLLDVLNTQSSDGEPAGAAEDRHESQVGEKQSMLRKEVTGWLDELVPKVGENAAQHAVAEEIAKELTARGLIQKAHELSSSDVEILVPKENVEE
eukprot:9189675-Karenia_brevis.AAC.1